MNCLKFIALCKAVLLGELLYLVIYECCCFGSTMGVTQNQCNYTFDQLVMRDLFVDKSMMIREFLKSKYLVNVITRPRKWGKSVNLGMLRRFFQVEVNKIGIQLKLLKRKYHVLFEGGEYIFKNKTSKILKPMQISNYSDCMKHMGMIPVAMLKLHDIKGSTYLEVKQKLEIEIRNSFFQHKYLKVYMGNESAMLTDTDKEKLAKYFSNEPLTTNELEEGVVFLTKVMFEHFRRKVIVLVDEKDAPLNNAVLSFNEHSGDTEKLMNLLQNIFKSVTNNWYMKKCLITGTLPFTEDALFQNTSKVRTSSVLDERFSDHFGFLESEVDNILKKAFPPNDTSVEKIKYWYKGFNHGGKMLYNPCEILNCMGNNGKLLNYWANSGRVKPLDQFLVTEEAQEDLQKLLEDEGIIKSLCKHDTTTSKEESYQAFFGIFYRLMVHHGYLNAFKLDNRNEYQLRIPNQEMRNLFVDYKTQWFCSKHDILKNDLHDVVHCLATKQPDCLRENLAKLFINFKNVTLKEEKDYHSIMTEVLGRLLNNNFVMYHKHFDLGRFYHMIVPRSQFQGHNSFVIEYKVLDRTLIYPDEVRALQELAQGTLELIDSDVYGPILTQYKYIRYVVTIAIAFCDTNLELAYKVFKQI